MKNPICSNKWEGFQILYIFTGNEGAQNSPDFYDTNIVIMAEIWLRMNSG